MSAGSVADRDEQASLNEMMSDHFSTIRQAAIFSGLKDEQLRLLIEAMHRRTVSPGPLLRQGEAGDALFVLVEGRLEVSYQPRRGQTIFIDEIKPGEVLGELACCDPAPLAASVAASELSVVYQLDRTLLETLRSHAPQLASAVYGGLIDCVSERSRVLEARILRSSGPLRRLGARVMPGKTAPVIQPSLDHTRMDGLSASDMELLGEVASRQTLVAGETLFSEGQSGDACYVVVEGQVDVLRGSQNRLRRLCTLGEGALVGQMAVMTEAKRSATIRAVSQTTVLKIGADLFHRLLASEQSFALRFQERITVATIRQHRRILERLDGIFQLATASPQDGDTQLDDPLAQTLGDHAACLRELSISPDELDNISVVVPDGQMTAAEIRARLGR